MNMYVLINGRQLPLIIIIDVDNIEDTPKRAITRGN